ncbi:unnamed protein product [Menidia menidia]|uniref:Protein shisa-5 n=1 Tax=Menidia menidia TaxID=238744 RepID=A0A8S4BPN4_9TELE|nr:unnamed protein product [Menidia menidia]
MVSGAFSSILCVFCLALAQAAWADSCSSYWDEDNDFHEAQQCSAFCCGYCAKRYCCSEKKYRFTQEKQERCPGSTNNKFKNIGIIVGSIIGSIVPIIVCATLIICCVAPCCFCYKKFRKRRSQRQIVVINSAGNTPQQPTSPFAYLPSYPGYQPVAETEGTCVPSAPPPFYMESTNQAQPVYAHHPSSQPNAPPSHLDELLPPPYNPTYGPNP